MPSYVLTATLHYSGEILFSIPEEIRHVAIMEDMKEKDIYTKPIPIGTGEASLVYSPEYRAWVRVWNKEKQ